MYFHCFDKKDLDEIYEIIDTFNDTEYIKKSDYTTEVLEYRFYLPMKYSNAFIGGLISGERYKRNKEW